MMMVDSSSTVVASPQASGNARWREAFRSLSSYFTALAGQGLLSLFHFGLNVYLIRTFEPYRYGLFAIAFVAAVMGAAVINALVATPVSVFTPGLERRAPRVFLETLLATVNFWLVGGILLMTLLATRSFNLPQDIAMAFSGFVAAYSARAYSRSFCFARRRPLVALYGDICYVLFSLTLLGTAWRSGWPISLTLLLTTLAVANLLAVLLEFSLLVERFRLLTQVRSLRHYLAIWLDVRWALVGVITTLIAAQAHSVLVTVFSGAAAYAPLAAGFVIFGPIRIGLQSWQSVMRPELAVIIASGDRAALQRMMRISMVSMFVAILLFAALLWIFWEPFSAFMYRAKYQGAPMGWIVAGWCGVTLFTVMATTPSGVLQAFKAFRVLAMGTVFSAGISLMGVGTLLWLLGPVYSLLGLLLAEAFLAFYLLRIVHNRIRGSW